ncbi:MAG: acyl transferase [Cyclobacteriaceae bacterium]|nr:acyl transferase [Cyclobacteriaceae bacterium]
MHTFKSFEKNLSTLNESNFKNIALSLFRLQAKENKVYQKYLTNLGVNVEEITKLEHIPFLPIAFFKEQSVVSGQWKEQTIFYSSSTTGAIPSKHYVKNLDTYLKNTECIFENFYGPIENFHFLALLPSYLEREGASLVAMADHFIKLSKSAHSSFYLNNKRELIKTLQKAGQLDRKVILLGVSFALLDLAEAYELDLSDCIVMETGGMKGRREEITRDEMHTYLCSRWNTKFIHSEYGMTELFSQAYAKEKGYFKTPVGMKVMIRSINDPFEQLEVGKTGGINVIDLSNIYTCAFVETQDLGRIRQDGSFEVLGRIDNSDIRGCNLLVG